MRETSIVASLDELKLIHLQRLADERAAIDRARAARDAEGHAREQARRDAEAADRKAARDADIRLEAAREAAVREARLRVEAARAAEQVRLEAELAAERDAGERLLRRETILRQRPRWMIAVTIVAVIGAIAFGASAILHAREVDAAQARETAARHQLDLAKHDADVAEAELAALQAKLAALHDQVDAAVTRLATVKEASDRQAALETVAAMRKNLADAEAARLEAKRRRDEAIRKAGFHNTTKCMQGVLDCLDK